MTNTKSSKNKRSLDIECLFKASLSCALAFSISSCVAAGGTGYDPYGNSGYGYGHDYDPYYDNDYRNRRERERLERERNNLERERIRLERERLEAERNSHHNKPVYNPPVYNRPPAQVRCPGGFTPSEQKCNNKERKRGCKDMRTSSGLGCVSSGFR